ncbi:PREDICTED: F-box protein At3g57590-like [Brassica oleracea var. oleracea]|uniref:F-box domain-containing protein n=1 Tax=Brassica oleracea var. oleracea TaxID=109376 RepID=A0A0D3BQR6_BRAOL|nr:PREDICTED: F-box protein At3g57590-like [Brassica oleracea var. oleracea]
MNRADNSASIPIDLILEILSRLPSKSVGRFHCVSKLWQSMLSCPYFKELYLTRSSARPRLLFVVHSVGEEKEEELHFYSSSQPRIPYDKSSLVVAADYHTTFPSERCNYASGLICFRVKGCSGEEAMTLICNPITGQYAELPKVIMYIPSKAFLGFDPIDKQFKILVDHHPSFPPRDRHIILTLGVPKLGWRSDICCPKYYGYLSEGICISGVIYYLVCPRYSKGVYEIVCFDVRYEEFKVIEAQCFYNHHQTLRLINYKGKLGGITGNLNDSGAIELRMWVLHDAEKQEWSEYVYTLPENDDVKLHDFTVAGMTTRGEFVLSMIDTFKPFYVFYFNPEKNVLRSVEIQGFGEDVSSVKVFVDHVEDFNFFKRESS